MFGNLKTPDLTPAQIVAIVQAIIAVIVAFGAPITQAQADAVLGLAQVLAIALVAGDAVVRHGRSRVAATAIKYPTPADGTPGHDCAQGYGIDEEPAS